MSHVKKLPVLVFAAGTLVSLLIVGAALIFMTPEQCPIYYTQAQVDATKCSVGANIVLGLAFMLAIGVWVVTIGVALGISNFKGNKKKKP